ncbi:MAG: helix-turn-helix domain-containing protein [Terracidiphilus sp.]
MNDALRKEDRRAVEALSSVVGNGARNDLYAALPGKDRLTVRSIAEKTQPVAAADAEPPKARLQALLPGAFFPEPLLDSDQAAAILQLHPKTLQRMARRREIRALQIGKVWRFRASVLDEWIQQRLAG